MIAAHGSSTIVFSACEKKLFKLPLANPNVRLLILGAFHELQEKYHCHVNLLTLYRYGRKKNSCIEFIIMILIINMGSFQFKFDCTTLRYELKWLNIKLNYCTK